MLLLPTPNSGANCGMPATWFWKSLNISFDLPFTAWHVTHLPWPKNTSAPRFSASVIAFSRPRANWSIGASANVSVNSNSAIARAK